MIFSPLASSSSNGFVGLLLASGAAAAAASSPDSSKYGTFDSPGTAVRPRFRYWLPDATVDLDYLRQDLRDVSALGAGGVQFQPIVMSGTMMSPMPPGADWGEGNVGTPKFHEAFRVALEAHQENNMTLDFSLGPHQGQGVPAHRDDEGLQWDLASFSAEFDSNHSFDGELPGWGDGDLVAAVVAEVLAVGNGSVSSYNELSQQTTTVYFPQYTLRHDSLTEVTSRVDTKTGKLFLHTGFVKPSGDSTTFRVFAHYEKLSRNQNLKFTPVKQETIFDDGSYKVDHFSAKGAQVVIDFWHKYILPDGNKELLENNGRYGWEDSLEIFSNASWTPDMPQRFERVAGYPLKRYLPLLVFQQNNIAMQVTQPGPWQAFLDSGDVDTYINDFRLTLEDGYGEYLQTLVNWTHNELGLEFSHQVGYNIPVDMLKMIPAVDTAECESLGMMDKPDSYRQFSGPAHLTGKEVVSNEVGAAHAAAFRYRLTALLYSVNIGYTSGLNQFIVHGQQYSGDYFSTWPGYVAFGYTFSENWSQKQPAWDNGLGDVLNYMARTQQVLYSARPQYDLVFLNKESAVDWTFPDRYPSSDLIDAGYTYSYLSPANLDLPQAVANDGVLAPDGPAYKALVIQSDQNVTNAGLIKLLEFADNGLPIFFTNGLPSHYPSRIEDGSDFDALIAELAAKASVTDLKGAVLGESLASKGIHPRVGVSTNGTWLQSIRKDEQGELYVIIMSEGAESSGTITVSTAKTPYLFNAWTGERTSVVNYRRSGGVITIPLSLSGNQTTIIALSDSLAENVPTPRYSVEEAPSRVVGTNLDDKGDIVLHLAGKANLDQGVSADSVQLSNGKSVPLARVSAPEQAVLGNWTLVAEHWEAPDDLEDGTQLGNRHNTTHELEELVSWKEIPALANVSGVGYYRTEFSWPPASYQCSPKALGAYLRLPPVLDAIRVRVNGRPVPTLDYLDPRADISEYLEEGDNEILVIVPTTMWNYLRTIIRDLRYGGRPPIIIGEPAPTVDSGLIGEVILTPFVRQPLRF